MNSEMAVSGCGCGSSAPAPQALAGGGLGFDLDEINWRSLKGEALTQALAMSGYATDPAALRAYYDAHEDVIDAYLDYVDVAAVVGDLATPGEGSSASDWVPMAVGAAGGVAVTLLYFSVFSNTES